MKNKIFSRKTRECYFNNLNPELGKFFLDCFNMDVFSGAQSKIITCFETESLRKKLFGVNTEYTGVILTGDILFWGMSGLKRGGFAATAFLKEIV